MQIKKKHKEAFLDGAKTNLMDINIRSQNTNLSWLNEKSYGLKAQKRQEYLQKFVKTLNKRKNRIEKDPVQFASDFISEDIKK